MTERKDKFERSYDEPLYWYNEACNLRAAAGAVWVSIDDDKPDSRLGQPAWFRMSAACRGPYYMLCGLALELCLKAIIISKKREPRRMHRLVDLAVDAGVSYDAVSLGLLRVLTESIEWAGRYPVPKGTKDKARERWDSACKSWTEHLHAREPIGRFSILKPNGALNWIGFNGLWEVANNEYWQCQSSE